MGLFLGQYKSSSFEITLLLQGLEGEAEISIGDEHEKVYMGQAAILSSHITYAVYAAGRVKLMRSMIKG